MFDSKSLTLRWWLAVVGVLISAVASASEGTDEVLVTRIAFGSCANQNAPQVLSVLLSSSRSVSVIMELPCCELLLATLIECSSPLENMPVIKISRVYFLARLATSLKCFKEKCGAVF